MIYCGAGIKKKGEPEVDRMTPLASVVYKIDKRDLRSTQFQDKHLKVGDMNCDFG